MYGGGGMLLKDLFVFLPKSKRSASYGKLEGKYPFFTSPNTIDKYVDEPDYNGSYLIIGDGGTGNCKYYDGEFSASDHNYIMFPKKGTNPHCVQYFLAKDNFQVLNEGFKGIGIKNVSKAYIENIDYRHNQKFSEDYICQTLGKIEELINKELSVLTLLDELTKSRFNELRDRERKTNTFRTFASIYSAKKCGNAKYPILSITKDNGIVFQDEKFKKRIASIDTKNYKIVPKGIFVQGIHIDEKNFDIQCIADNGIVSPAYKLWRINENICVPLVVAYAMRTDFVASYIKDKSSGSVDRRENLSNEEMKCIPLNLPSILAQKEFFKFKEQDDKLKFI
jgi:restriction endonuclease S subunit